MLESRQANVGAAFSRTRRDRDTESTARGVLCQLEPMRQEVPILGYDDE